jgi:AraC-like DNA-binding protein
MAAAPLLDEWMLEATARLGPSDALAAAAMVAIVRSHGERPIAGVARELASSPRRLQRRFSAAVGLTPKEFARIRRLRAAAAVLLGDDEPSWSRIAAERGFADQSHLIREFTAMARMSPAVFAARLREIEHAAVTP